MPKGTRRYGQAAGDLPGVLTDLEGEGTGARHRINGAEANVSLSSRKDLAYFGTSARGVAGTRRVTQTRASRILGLTGRKALIVGMEVGPGQKRTHSGTSPNSNCAGSRRPGQGRDCIGGIAVSHLDDHGALPRSRRWT